jgi:hypothetical protein
MSHFLQPLKINTANEIKHYLQFSRKSQIDEIIRAGEEHVNSKKSEFPLQDHFSLVAVSVSNNCIQSI